MILESNLDLMRFEQIINTMKILCLLSLFCIAFSTDWSNVEQVIQEGINQNIFSGCVLGVATQNATLYKKAFGTVTPKRGFYAPAVTIDMKFDINYLTQVIGTNSVIMEMYDTNKLNTTNRVSVLFYDFDNNGKRYITIQNLLEHNSGLQATYNLTYPKTAAQLFKAINNLKLDYTTEAKSVYSELGHIVLGQVIQKLRNQTLDEAIFQILTIAGLRDTTYHPSTSRDKIVPGGYDGGIAWATPFNKACHFLGGMTGHSGLFSTVDNLITYMQLMLNRGKIPNYSRVFSQEVVDRFLNVTTYKGYKNTRTLGWETVPAVNPPCGKKFSPSPFSFGLSDTSGSYVWADKKRNVTIVLLANGNFPRATVVDPSIYQGTLSDTIMTALGY